jgi:hypothetical protein
MCVCAVPYPYTRPSGVVICAKCGRTFEQQTRKKPRP